MPSDATDSIRPKSNHTADWWSEVANAQLLDHIRSRLARNPRWLGPYGATRPYFSLATSRYFDRRPADKPGDPPRVSAPPALPCGSGDPYDKSIQAQATMILVRWAKLWARDMADNPNLPPRSEAKRFWADYMAQAQSEITQLLESFGVVQ